MLAPTVTPAGRLITLKESVYHKFWRNSEISEIKSCNYIKLHTPAAQGHNRRAVYLFKKLL